MRVFSPVVAPSAAPVVLLDAEVAGSGAIRPQVVGNQQVWNEAVLLQQLAHELQRGMLVAFGLDQHIEDLAFGVDGAPKVDQTAVDLQVDLIQMAGLCAACAGVYASPTQSACPCSELQKPSKR